MLDRVADTLSESERVRHMNRLALDIVLFETWEFKTMRSAYCFAVPWLYVAPSALGAEP